MPSGLHCTWSSTRNSNKKIQLPGIVVQSDQHGTTVMPLGGGQPQAVLKTDVVPEEHRLGETVQCRQMQYSELHEAETQHAPEDTSYWYKAKIIQINPPEDRSSLPTYVVQPVLKEHGIMVLDAENVRRTWWEQHETGLTSDGPQGPSRPEKAAVQRESKERAERNSENASKKRNDSKQQVAKGGESLNDLMKETEQNLFDGDGGDGGSDVDPLTVVPGDELEAVFDVKLQRVVPADKSGVFVDVNVDVNVGVKPGVKEVTASAVKPNENTDPADEVTESKTVTGKPAKPNEKTDPAVEVTKTKAVTVGVNPENVGVNPEPPKKRKKVDASSLQLDYEQVVNDVRTHLMNPENINRKVLTLTIMNLLVKYPNTNVVPTQVRVKRGKKAGLEFKLHDRVGRKSGGQRLGVYVPKKLQTPPEDHPHYPNKRRDIYFFSENTDLTDTEFVYWAIDRVHKETRGMDDDELRHYIHDGWVGKKIECPLCERVRREYADESH